MSNIDSSTERKTRGFEAEASTELPEGLIEALRTPARFMATVVLGAALAGGASVVPFTDPLHRKRDDLQSTSSTSSTIANPLLALTVKELFDAGAAEFFQDGMESTFSRTLASLLARYGADAVTAIAEYLFAGQAEPEVVSEALRWLADFGGPETLPKRWAILRHGLKNSSPIVRDGAILGFAALNDRRARSLLLKARNVEQIKALQRLIDRVAAGLGHAR